MSQLSHEAARLHESRWKRLADDARARTVGDRVAQAALTLGIPPYALGGWLHRIAYRTGLCPTRRVETPVVCVGNLSLGGTGKTPVVAWLAGWLTERGLRCAVVSRGYGGRTEGGRARQVAVVGEGAGPLLSPAEAGDEPVLLATLLPGVPVVVGRNRYDAARLAEKRFAPDVILLDDGFQHYQFHRDYDLVVIDASRPFKTLRRFPRGTLREGLGALRRADGVLLTRCDRTRPAEVRSWIRRLRRWFPHLVLAPSWMKPEGLATLEGLRPRPEPDEKKTEETENAAAKGEETAPASVMELLVEKALDAAPGSEEAVEERIEIAPETLAGKRALGFCGVGNPDSVRASLEAMGLTVVALTELPDHVAAPVPMLVRMRERLAAGEADYLVCTAKDAVKIAPEHRHHDQFPLMVAKVGLEIRPARAAERLREHLTRLALPKKQ